MLQIIVQGQEMWNEELEIYEYSATTELDLEHSLVSISKWESIWHKPFFSREPHTEEETMSYIKCMTINHNVKDLVYAAMTNEDMNKIADYIEDTQSAIPKQKGKGHSRELITSEKIYSWMFGYGIPKECEKWHISRLLNVIDLLNDANTPAKKRSPNEIARDYASINAKRKAKLHTRG